MRQTLSLLLTLSILIHSASASPDTASVTGQIVAMHLGASLELRLKNKQKLRGSRGAVSNTGFAFLDAHASEQQIAFDDIASVKQVGASHVKRNVLIGVGDRGGRGGDPVRRLRAGARQAGPHHFD